MQRSILVTFVVVIVVLVVIAVGYGIYASTQHTTSTTQSQQLKVLASFYPIYDFARNVGGDRANVTLLVPSTVDVHEFEPTPSSIQAVASANMLIINGAGLEPWEPAIVASANNPNLISVNCSKGISLIKLPPEFQSGNRTVDPHIWLDPVIVKMMVNNILQGYISADPTDKQYFTANAQAYDAKLDFLNQQIINETSNTKIMSIVTFHTAFAYFAQQYNLTQIPVFGPFEDSPTAQDIQNVVNVIHQYHLCYVGYESLENPAIPESIASQTNATLILMDPIEGITDAQQVSGMNYLSLMQMDVNNISLALNHTGCS